MVPVMRRSSCPRSPEPIVMARLPSADIRQAYVFRMLVHCMARKAARPQQWFQAAPGPAHSCQRWHAGSCPLDAAPRASQAKQSTREEKKKNSSKRNTKRIIKTIETTAVFTISKVRVLVVRRLHYVLACSLARVLRIPPAVATAG